MIPQAQSSRAVFALGRDDPLLVLVVVGNAGAVAERMEAGDKFPPVIVFHDGSDYWLADGFHRVSGSLRAGWKSIDADVRQGNQRDAILYSVGANGSHGKPRTNADKRRAVQRLLNDSEWVKWSDRKIAEACCVTHPFVASLRTSGNDYQMRKVERNGKVYEQDTANIGRSRAEKSVEVVDTDTGEVVENAEVVTTTVSSGCSQMPSATNGGA